MVPNPINANIKELTTVMKPWKTAFGEENKAWQSYELQRLLCIRKVNLG